MPPFELCVFLFSALRVGKRELAVQVSNPRPRL